MLRPIPRWRTTRTAVAPRRPLRETTLHGGRPGLEPRLARSLRVLRRQELPSPPAHAWKRSATTQLAQIAASRNSAQFAPRENPLRRPSNSLNGTVMKKYLAAIALINTQLRRLARSVGRRGVLVGARPFGSFSYRDPPFGLGSMAVVSDAWHGQRFLATRPTRSERHL